MESVRQAKQRIRRYPALVAKCAPQATRYAACVTRDLNVQHNACATEFDSFRQCLLLAAKAMNTKL